jgi:hypothetical protein
MRYLHSGIPPNDYLDFRNPAHIEIRDEFFRGKNAKRAVVFLLSNGCEWALKSGNGCTMCGHIAKQARKDQPISTDDFITQFEIASIDFSEIPVLNIFNSSPFSMTTSSTRAQPPFEPDRKNTDVRDFWWKAGRIHHGQDPKRNPSLQERR